MSIYPKLPLFNRGLPAFRVFMENGTCYVTSMAEGVTIDQAKAHFVGNFFTQSDETCLKCIRVHDLNSLPEWKEDEVVARWETKGKDWIELSRARQLGDYKYRCGPTYASGGVYAESDEQAVERMEYPWGHPEGTGQATVLRSDRPSLRRVK